MSNDKLIFSVVILILIMVSYNYYTLIKMQSHVDDSFKMHKATKEHLLVINKRDLSFLDDLEVAVDLDETLKTLRTERKLINLRHADILKRLNTAEETIRELQTE